MTSQEATYVYGPMGRIATKVGGITDYYNNDHLGSTRLKTDESGNVISTVTYRPFGESTVIGEKDPYSYNGKEEDVTGLLYYGARYYSPDTGRFLTRDTWTYLPNDIRSLGNTNKHWLNDPHIFNRYCYCRNNPLRYADPSGHGWLGVAFAAFVLVLCIIAIIICPVTAPIYVLGMAYFFAVVAAYDVMWEFFKATQVKVERHWGDLERTKLVGVDWFSGDGERIGGWAKVEGGYLIWSTELNDWVPISEDEYDWTPPPPPQPGGGTIPVTWESIKDELKRKNPNPNPTSTGNENSPLPAGPKGRNYSVI